MYNTNTTSTSSRNQKGVQRAVRKASLGFLKDGHLRGRSSDAPHDITMEEEDEDNIGAADGKENTDP